jgi:hypothetical protein
MKKIVYFVIGGTLLFVVCGSALAETLELHDVKRILTFPEAGGLIVLGSLLISGATFLRRRRAARGQ